MKVSKLMIVVVALILIVSYFGGQFTGYLNRRVAEGMAPQEMHQDPTKYIHEWVEDTNGRWVW